MAEEKKHKRRFVEKTSSPQTINMIYAPVVVRFIVRKTISLSSRASAIETSTSTITEIMIKANDEKW